MFVTWVVWVYWILALYMCSPYNSLIHLLGKYLGYKNPSLLFCKSCKLAKVCVWKSPWRFTEKDYRALSGRVFPCLSLCKPEAPAFEIVPILRNEDLGVKRYKWWGLGVYSSYSFPSRKLITHGVYTSSLASVWNHIAPSNFFLGSKAGRNLMVRYII